MKRKEIVFTINKNGEITSTIKGIKGSSCSSITGALKSMGKVVAEIRTSEYFEKGVVSTCVKGTTGKTEG